MQTLPEVLGVVHELGYPLLTCEDKKTLEIVQHYIKKILSSIPDNFGT